MEQETEVTEAAIVDALERQTRRNVLLALIAELYEARLSDAISMREWLQSKLDEQSEGEPQCVNHYLCPKDSTRWDAGWSCLADDRCPTCDGVVEPFATTRNLDGHETIHNREIYDKAKDRKSVV